MATTPRRARTFERKPLARAQTPACMKLNMNPGSKIRACFQKFFKCLFLEMMSVHASFFADKSSVQRFGQKKTLDFTTQKNARFQIIGQSCFCKTILSADFSFRFNSHQIWKIRSKMPEFQVGQTRRQKPLVRARKYAICNLKYVYIYMRMCLCECQRIYVHMSL